MFGSVLVPTKRRFTDSSDAIQFQELQHQRSNLVHERRQLSLQPHPKRILLLHKWTIRPLSEVPEAPRLRWHLLCRSRRLVSVVFRWRRRSLLSKRIWLSSSQSEIVVLVVAHFCFLHCRCFAGLRCRRRCYHVKGQFLNILFILSEKPKMFGLFFFLDIYYLLIIYLYFTSPSNLLFSRQFDFFFLNA